MTKEAKVYNGEKTVFSTNGAGKLDIHGQKNKAGPLLYTTDKINSKQIKDLNVKAKIIQPLEENIEEDLHSAGCGSALLDGTPTARQPTRKQISRTSSK